MATERSARAREAIGMTIELLDEQVAARIAAECRDRDAVHRLQRATFIAETVLEGLHLVQTMKASRKIRTQLPTIIEVLPPQEPADSLMPPFLSRVNGHRANESLHSHERVRP